MRIKVSGDAVHFEHLLGVKILRSATRISCTVSKHGRGISLVSSAIKSQSIAASDSLDAMKRFDTALAY